MTIGERLLMILVYALLIGILVGVPYLFLFGGARKFLLNTLHRRFNGIDHRPNPQNGDVGFVYHTYRGFLFWFTQDEHRVFASPQQAKILLGRLLRFNLTWGMMSYGLLFIPFLAIGNYLAQKRSIAQQETQHNPDEIA